MSTYPIKTVVVLVQENRSAPNPTPSPPPTPTRTSSTSATDPSTSTRIRGNSLQAIYEQVFGEEFSINSSIEVPLMKGFAQQAEKTQKGMSETVMNGFRPDALPVYKELLSEFAVFDRWFASLPAYTQPNRLFVHSATSHGATSNDIEKLMEGYPQKTIFDSLDENGFSFGIYYQ